MQIRASVTTTLVYYGKTRKLKWRQSECFGSSEFVRVLPPRWSCWRMASSFFFFFFLHSSAPAVTAALIRCLQVSTDSLISLWHPAFGLSHLGNPPPHPVWPMTPDCPSSWGHMVKILSTKTWAAQSWWNSLDMKTWQRNDVQTDLTRMCLL